MDLDTLCSVLADRSWSALRRKDWHEASAFGASLGTESEGYASEFGLLRETEPECRVSELGRWQRFMV